VPWFHAHFTPATPLTDQGARLGLATVSLVGFVATGLASLLPSLRATLHVLLPLFAFVAFGNALQHAFWWGHLGVYAPGAATSLVTVVPATLYVSWRAYQSGEVSLWFLGLIYAFALVPLGSAVAAGPRLLPEHLAMHRFFTQLAAWLWGAA